MTQEKLTYKAKQTSRPNSPYTNTKMQPKISYSISESDFLEFQMYESSLTPSHQKQRARSLWLPIFTASLVGFFAFIRSEAIMAACLFFYCGLWVILHKKYTKWRYSQHFKTAIKKNHQNALGVEASLEIEGNAIKSSSLSANGSIELAQIESLTEIENLFLIKLKNGQTLFLPKKDIESDKLEFFMATVSQKTSLPIENDVGRTWK